MGKPQKATAGDLEPLRCKQMQIEQKTNDRWLLTFNENLAKVMATQGFVIQIQQGVEREKSFMQDAHGTSQGWCRKMQWYFVFIGGFSFVQHEETRD